MIEIPVELGERRYPILIGHGLARLLGEVLASQKGRRALVVSSPRVWSRHGATVARGLRALAPQGPVLFADGERHKTRETLARLHDAFVAAKLGRDGLVVAVGGGVVGDVAGFAAATYMRGIPWVGVPTTLLSMVDSSIGGKVGVNHPKGKNLLGAFHQPRAVVIDPAFLETLPAREVRSGAYEVLKYGVLGDRALFHAFLGAPPDLREWARTELENAIATSCRIKALVVEKDEREKGLRKILNLGHTLGHALETVTRYRRFTHGEAVGWGLLGAAGHRSAQGLAEGRGGRGHRQGRGPPGPPPADVGPVRECPILEAVSRDKKAEAGRVPFILPTAIGRVIIRHDVAVAEIRHALRVMARHEA